VRTYNRAMNQNHTSWLYIDIRLAATATCWANEGKARRRTRPLPLEISPVSPLQVPPVRTWIRVPELQRAPCKCQRRRR